MGSPPIGATSPASYRVGSPLVPSPLPSPLRQTGEAQAGDIELWRGGATEQRGQPGDRPYGVERRRPPEIRAPLDMSHSREVEGRTIINPFR